MAFSTGYRNREEIINIKDPRILRLIEIVAAIEYDNQSPLIPQVLKFLGGATVLNDSHERRLLNLQADFVEGQISRGDFHAAVSGFVDNVTEDFAEAVVAAEFRYCNAAQNLGDLSDWAGDLLMVRESSVDETLRVRLFCEDGNGNDVPRGQDEPKPP